MTPIKHPSNTRTLGAPVGWDQSGLPVEPLGITDTELEGVPCVMSFWQPDDVDLANIAAGGLIGLSIVGRTMPPACVVTLYPAEPARGDASTPWGRQAKASERHATEAEAFRRYLVECDEHAISPDVAGAFHWAWTNIPAAAVTATIAARDVLIERQRQIIAEGWTPAHDDGHVNEEIAALACFYAMPPGAREWSAKDTGYGDTLGQAIVPDGWCPKENDRRTELVKAGALILAELERLDRSTAAEIKEAQL